MSSDPLPGWMLYELHLVETEWTAWLHNLGFPNLEVKFDVTPLDIYTE